MIVPQRNRRLTTYLYSTAMRDFGIISWCEILVLNIGRFDVATNRPYKFVLINPLRIYL